MKSFFSSICFSILIVIASEHINNKLLFSLSNQAEHGLVTIEGGLMKICANVTFSRISRRYTTIMLSEFFKYVVLILSNDCFIATEHYIVEEQTRYSLGFESTKKTVIFNISGEAHLVSCYVKKLTFVNVSVQIVPMEYLQSTDSPYTPCPVSGSNSLLYPIIPMIIL